MMRNLAGNPVAIFLYRFELVKGGISFVLSEAIAEDMYPEIDMQIQPLAHACSQTLLRHKDNCREETIMDGNILVDGCFEVMLSEGLGKHIADSEKQNLFNDAQKIANLLILVMDRRTKEMEQGTYPGPQAINTISQRSMTTKEGLQALGNKQKAAADLQQIEGGTPDIERMLPGDLPPGVVASRSYDHRGYCWLFESETLGELGVIILTGTEDDRTMMLAEMITVEDGFSGERQKLFEETTSAIQAKFESI